MRRLGAIFAALALAACVPDEVTNTNESTDTQANSSPTGSIVGVITSAVDGSAIVGAQVSVQTSGGGFVTVNSGTQGEYVLANLLAGQNYTIRVSAAGYAPESDAGDLEATAGLYPANTVIHVDFDLSEATATVTGIVRDEDTGVPVEGVTVIADLRDWGFNLVVSDVTDSTGRYTLPSLPGDTGVPLKNLALDVDGNGDMDYDADAQGTAWTNFDSTTSYDFWVSKTPIRLLSRNMIDTGWGWYELDMNDSIQLVFDHDIDAATSSFMVYDTSGWSDLLVATVATVSGRTVTISPDAATEWAEHDYRIDIGAEGLAGTYLNTSFDFYAVGAPVIVTPPVLGDVTLVTVTPTADYDTTAFNLTWNTIADATGYNIWARDSLNNPDWVLIDYASAVTVPTRPVTQTRNGVTLPVTFHSDTSGELWWQAPFMNGTTVQFMVVGDYYGMSDLPSAGSVGKTVADGVNPTASYGQSSGFNNAGGSPLNVVLYIYFSEPMAVGANPTFTSTGTTPGSVTWTWDSTRTTAQAAFTIPALTNYAGSAWTFTASDTSGHSVDFSYTPY